MQTKNILLGLLSLTAIAEASAIHRPFDNIVERRELRYLQDRQNVQANNNKFGGGNGQGQGQTGQNNQGNNQGNAQANQGNNNNGGNNNGNGATVTLDANAIQTGSASDGNPDTSTGEAPSATDTANFINFCSGKVLTNGLQNTAGSCNGIVMGNIPAKTNMVSSVFVNPQNNDDITANQDFQVQIQVANFAPGTFTNADTTYYTAPQDLDGSGNIIGHTHVTIQDLGNSLNPTTPLDATQFAFFKGINDAGNGQGLLSADVAGGLPTGNYRLCSMSSAANHQPVLMPVAQRGAQDDCVRFTVGGGSGNNNGNNGNANANNGNNANNGQNTQTGQNGQTGQTGQNGQKGQKGQGQNNSNSTEAQTGNNQANNSQNSDALGGIAAPAVTNSGDTSRPFAVNGNTFVNQGAAIQRSCDIQQNACSNAANSGASFTVTDCQTQQQQCNASAGQ